MTLRLDEVCDLDCLVSMAPLVVDLPKAEVYARGIDAIVRRVLYVWIGQAGLLELEGRSFSVGEQVELRGTLETLAGEQEYVLTADVTLDLDDNNGLLAIGCDLRFVDGRTYTFSVSTADAVSLTFPEAA